MQTYLSSRTALAGLVLLAGACRGPRDAVPANDATSVAPVPTTPPTPAVFGVSAIDSALSGQWKKTGVTPSPRASDSVFLRRVYLDVVGTVPPPEVVTSFLADRAADKRAKLVDRLLESPAYATYWSTLWEDTLVGWDTRAQDVDRGALREWLYGEFAANAPWDKVVTELLTATGQNSHGGARQDGTVTMPVGGSDASALAAERGPVNGAVNWFLKYRETPQDIAGNASRIFLGVQIQCAQCHDHKTEKWKQADFQRFAACFARTRSEAIDKGKVMGLRRMRVTDSNRPLPRFAQKPDLVPILRAEPTTLDGQDLGRSPSVRGALAAWLTAKNNPWFAKAIVNRMWGHFLGRGFVDPVDDIRDSNFTALPELFTTLSDDFAQRGDDLKALIRTITSTAAYQLAPASVVAPENGKPPPSSFLAGQAEQYWARFHVTPLGPNELIRSILDATGVENSLAVRNPAQLDRIRFQIYRRYSFLFDVDEDFEQTDFEGTVAQALSLLNGPLVGAGVAAVPGSALDEILKSLTSDADKVAALYLRTLTRLPSSEESAYWVRYVNEPHAVETARLEEPSAAPPPVPLRKKNGKVPKVAKATGALPGRDPLTRLEERDLSSRPDSRRQAYEDLFWALLNSSEFTLNH